MTCTHETEIGKYVLTIEYDYEPPLASSDPLVPDCAAIITVTGAIFRDHTVTDLLDHVHPDWHIEAAQKITQALDGKSPFELAFDPEDYAIDDFDDEPNY